MAQPTSTKGAWRITFLLFLYMLVNFADKVIVGLAGVPIMTEMQLTPQQFGLLGSAFFALFSVSAIVVGFIVNKVATRWVLLVLAVVWALVQFPMIYPVSFTTLLICRIILGAGEGPAFSVAVHAIYKWYPDEKRTFPTAILSQGSAFGVILAVPALNWVIVNYSWHAAFGALGVFGLFWVVLWLIWGKEGPLLDEPVDIPGVGAVTHIPYGRLLTSPTFIGCVAATFGSYWALSLGLTWFTPFIRALGYSQKEAGLISVLPWVFGAVIVLLAGWISQVMVGRGMTTRTARGILGAAPVAIGGLLLLAMPMAGSPAALIGLLVLGTGLSGAIYVVCPPMISEFVPTSQRGAMISIYGALYTIAGLLAPFTMGTVIQNAATPLDGFYGGFKILGCILVAAGVIGLALLWPNSERARLTSGGRVAA